ncbi:Ion channel POLLUX [Acorus calamus]|uniref:Ion channel POLLUX n=1 Tax=Acorus calamus TaxID=4465 RepID=A0AAV9EC03_ACOCL|nr:Ion channel POLLUX [Acorus calamus]
MSCGAPPIVAPLLLRSFKASQSQAATHESKRLPCKEAKINPTCHIGFSHLSWTREMQQALDRSIVISEILDSRTRNLVSVSRISDYVLSNELVSMALAIIVTKYSDY